MLYIRWEKHQGQIHRYYQIYLNKDLFNKWVVVKQWGKVDSAKGGQITVPCSSQAQAKMELKAIEKRRLSRGYLPIKVTEYSSKNLQNKK